MKTKVYNVLVRHEDGDVLLIKRSMKERVYKGAFQTTVMGVSWSNEDEVTFLEQILKDGTSISCNQFTEVPYAKLQESVVEWHFFVCHVNCDKNSIQKQNGEKLEYQWMKEEEFKEFVNSEKMIPIYKRGYHSYFVERGWCKSYYTEERMREELEDLDDDVKMRLGFAWYDPELPGVQLYVWDKELPQLYAKFEIAKHIQWSKEKEKRFQQYMREEIYILEDDVEAVLYCCKEKMPDIKLKRYAMPGKMFRHIYYTLHSDEKGELFKEGLDYIADCVEAVDKYHLPKALLKSLNTTVGCELLKEQKTIVALKDFYQRTPQYFNKVLEAEDVYRLADILNKEYEVLSQFSLPVDEEVRTWIETYAEIKKLKFRKEEPVFELIDDDDDLPFD